MGAWGAGIFSNDLALDVKQDYMALLGLGVPEDEAYQLIKNRYELIEGDDVETWFAIADIQQRYGILHPEVKENALLCVSLDKEMWQDSDKQTIQKRVKVREDLKARLLAPPLQKRKVPKPRVGKHRWKVGDVVASKIVNVSRTNHWYHNKYVLYRVIDVRHSSVTILMPELAYEEKAYAVMYEWIGDELPSPSILQDLDYCRCIYYDGDDGLKRIDTHCLSWIPKDQQLILFKQDANYVPLSPGCIRPYIGYGCMNVYVTIDRADAHFKAIYEKYKTHNK